MPIVMIFLLGKNELENLGDDDIALRPHLEVKIWDRLQLKTTIRVFNPKYDPSAIPSSPRSSSSLGYHARSQQEKSL